MNQSETEHLPPALPMHVAMDPHGYEPSRVGNLQGYIDDISD